MVTMGKLSATICVPFGAETVENDPCTVGTTRNYTTGTGNRQNTSAQAKERNRQAFQRRMAQKTARIHVAERETSQVFGAEPQTKTSGISAQKKSFRPRRGGDYNEVPHAIPSPSNCVMLFSLPLSLSTGFRVSVRVLFSAFYTHS